MSSSQNSTEPSSKTALKAGKELRLNRFLADCGLGSRRKVEEFISGGRVTINGVVCIDLSQKINTDNDVIELDGKALSAKKEKVYILLNKPRGFVVSQADELGRETVYSLLPENAANMAYAGRLDKNSEGLLLFTNDTALINLLTHPSYKVEKVYKVDIDRPLRKRELDLLRSGVEIEGGITHRAGVFVKEEGEGSMSLKIVISEGRKRQIRQMIEAVGAKVRKLKRLQFGPLKLKDLPTGRWRYLEPGEVRALFSERNIRSLPPERATATPDQALKKEFKSPRKENVYTGETVRQESKPDSRKGERHGLVDKKPYHKPKEFGDRSDKRVYDKEKPSKYQENRSFNKDTPATFADKRPKRQAFHQDTPSSRDDRKPHPKETSPDRTRNTYNKDDARPKRGDSRQDKPGNKGKMADKHTFSKSKPAKRGERKPLSKNAPRKTAAKQSNKR